MKEVFGFAERQDICTYDLAYKTKLNRKSDNHVLGHTTGANDAANFALAGRVIVEDISLYVLQYTRNKSNQNFLLGNFGCKTPKELSFIKRSSYMNVVTTENNRTFELGVGDGIDIPNCVMVGFMQRNHFNQQHQKKDTFYRPSVVNDQCIIGGEKFLDVGINCIYAID